MISGAYTSNEKAGRLFFKRTAVFFWEDSEWGAGLFARAPKGKPVYFSMICSASSSRRRLICHVVTGDPESPNGVRYCLNSAALRVVPYEKMEAEGYGYLLYLFEK